MRLVVGDITRGRTKDTAWSRGGLQRHASVSGTHDVDQLCRDRERRLTRARGNGSVWEVSRAHLYGKSLRWVYTTLPKGHEQLRKLARLERCLCGTYAWFDLERHVGRQSFSRQESTWRRCPALFCGTSESGDMLRRLCRGDDSVVIASRRRLADIGELSTEHLQARPTGHIGFASDVGQSLRVLTEPSAPTSSSTPLCSNPTCAISVKWSAWPIPRA